MAVKGAGHAGYAGLSDFTLAVDVACYDVSRVNGLEVACHVRSHWERCSQGLIVGSWKLGDLAGLG